MSSRSTNLKTSSTPHLTTKPKPISSHAHTTNATPNSTLVDASMLSVSVHYNNVNRDIFPHYIILYCLCFIITIVAISFSIFLRQYLIRKFRYFQIKVNCLPPIYNGANNYLLPLSLQDNLLDSLDSFDSTYEDIVYEAETRM